MTKRFRTAVLGTGFMGRVHLEALRRTENVDVAAIAGRNAAAAEKLGSAFAVPHASSDVVLRDPTIDAIHICTPNAQHFPMAKAALLAGKHVLCEKPLAVSVAEAQELAALAVQKGLRNCVCHNLRYYPCLLYTSDASNPLRSTHTHPSLPIHFVPIAIAGDPPAIVIVTSTG